MRRSEMVRVEAGNRGAVNILILYASRTTSVFLKRNPFTMFTVTSAVETESRSTQEDCQEGDDGNDNGND